MAFFNMTVHTDNQLERVRRSFEEQAFMAHLGATLGRVEAGRVEIVLPFSGAIGQQHGFVHAGAITAIVDSACGYAAMSVGTPGCEVLSIEFKINMLKPAVGDRFVGIGEVVRAGRQVCVTRGQVLSEAGGRAAACVAVMQATMMYQQPAE